jgi:hypothetical protein
VRLFGVDFFSFWDFQVIIALRSNVVKNAFSAVGKTNAALIWLGAGLALLLPDRKATLGASAAL